MELYGQQSKSIPQKAIIHLIEILLLWLSFWILFQNGGNWMANQLHSTNSGLFIRAEFPRRVTLQRKKTRWAGFEITRNNLEFSKCGNLGLLISD